MGAELIDNYPIKRRGNTLSGTGVNLRMNAENRPSPQASNLEKV